MSAKEQAILDIHEELQRVKRDFIPFRNELNPVMDKIVSQQLFAQSYNPLKATARLVAHCAFITATEVKLLDYSKYYGSNKES